MQQLNPQLLILSRYARLGASSRLRFYQFVSCLESSGFRINIEPLLDNEYITNLYAGRRTRFINIVKTYFSRLLCIKSSAHFNIVWVEKELLPWLPAWLELNLLPQHISLVVDYDDAIFHQYDQHKSALVRWLLGNKIDSIMRRANLVIAGNSYLADRARQAGARRVEILPTVVDTTRYSVFSQLDSKQIIIGWIGSPATVHYLRLIAPALQEIGKLRNIGFVAVGANASQLEGLPIDAVQWTEESEVEQIQHFDIGIMPLPDEPFARGKCGYKLIQCMACGKPVVASPIGANAEIVRDGVEGFLASSQADWVAMLTRLIDDSSLRISMGSAGRTRVENVYSLNAAAVKLELLLRSVSGQQPRRPNKQG
ncbi:MAG: glycosyltransferase family 4 protein [Methylobacter sp.]